MNGIGQAREPHAALLVQNAALQLYAQVLIIILFYLLKLIKNIILQRKKNFKKDKNTQ